MSLESVSRLSELTGLDRRTLKKHLIEFKPIIEGRSHLYESHDVLRVIYGGASADDLYDLTEERARLAHHQANNEGLKELENKGELVRADEVRAAWEEKTAATRAQLLSLPSKAAPMVVTVDGDVAVESMLRKMINEALDELAGSGLPREFEKRMDSIGRGMDAAAGSDIERVG